MVRAVLMEQFHVDVFVPKGLSTTASAAIRRTLRQPTFRVRMATVVLDVIKNHPSLKTVSVKVSW